jgi:hypothetical protein
MENHKVTQALVVETHMVRVLARIRAHVKLGGQGRNVKLQFVMESLETVVHAPIMEHVMLWIHVSVTRIGD